MSDGIGFGGFFENSTVLFFILVFLILFWCPGFGGGFVDPK
ncbi:MAG: hypothetical protein Q8920_09005 [Bacillota bacterium]|nr:hypothetical protein [Bacillota bacterium]